MIPLPSSWLPRHLNLHDLLRYNAKNGQREPRFSHVFKIPKKAVLKWNMSKFSFKMSFSEL